MVRKRQSATAAPAKLRYSFQKILTGSDLSHRRLPLMSATSGEPGPVVWLTACGHGDEICGMVIIQEVFRKIRRSLVYGAVHAFPLMNPIGFETGSRHITVSREDLNRSFPGDAAGSLGRRIADRIFSTIMETSPSLVLDLHNDWAKSIPYVLLDSRSRSRPVSGATYQRTQVLAQQTGFVAILDTDELTSTLSYSLLVNDVPALTLELGEPYVINEANVEFGVKAIWNILAHLGMVTPPDAPFNYPLPQAYRPGAIFRYSEKPYSSKSGIVRFLAAPGDELKSGQPFARIVNAFGKHQETVKTLHDAIVLGHSDSSVVFPGMPIMAFGVT